jgi:hypothetical protein
LFFDIDDVALNVSVQVGAKTPAVRVCMFKDVAKPEGISLTFATNQILRGNANPHNQFLMIWGFLCVQQTVYLAVTTL